MGAQKKYRDKVYIVKDIILTLTEYGELNQTSLYSFCGLNLTKHKHILDELEEKKLIQKNQRASGKRMITYFTVTQKGLEFCRTILDPFEELFPRITEHKEDSENKLAFFFFI